jgi:hypothetical protein
MENRDRENETIASNSSTTSLHPKKRFPAAQLAIISLVQFAEPITSTVIYPFINQFVRETGITRGDEKKTGYYAGIIVRTSQSI